MTNEQLFRFLDLGGGPDISEDEDEITKLRATRLSIENPNGEYFVLDPRLLKLDPLYKKFGKPPSNLHFITGEVHSLSSIPIKEDSFDVVEMNFIFVPLSTARVDQPLDLEKFEEWKKTMLISPSDAPLYAQAVRESARVLKEGGKLIICEKKQRMSRILPLLGLNDSLAVNSPFLRDECKLSPICMIEINDQTRSWWTNKRLKERERYISQENIIKADESIVLALQFSKN